MRPSPVGPLPRLRWTDRGKAIDLRGANDGGWRAAVVQDEPMADNDKYDKALLRLQQELVSMQQWVREEGKRVVIVVEGRDAAGKGGVIKRITEHLNPRWCRIAALPAPSDREKTEWYFQRYIAHLPAGGEIVLFDRSGTTGRGRASNGILHRRGVPPFLPPVPGVERCHRRRIHLGQVLVLGER